MARRRLRFGVGNAGAAKACGCRCLGTAGLLAGRCGTVEGEGRRWDAFPAWGNGGSEGKKRAGGAAHLSPSLSQLYAHQQR